MCFIKFCSPTQTSSKSKYLIQAPEKSETQFSAQIKLEENNDQRYIIMLKDGFLILYPLSVVDSEQLRRITLDFDVRMSTIKKEHHNALSIKNQKQFKGIKLQDSHSLNLSLYFRTSEQAQLWLKKLSFYVNQLNFERHFRVVRKLGRGASAAVFQVKKIQNGKKYAVKAFAKQGLVQSQQKLQSLKKQVEILRDLNTEKIIDFQGVFEDDKAYYLVMELIRGVNIFDFLFHLKRKLELSEIKLIMKNILKNILYLEELDIVHRDIKLQNIIIDHLTLETKIIDYGLAVYASEDYIFYNCGTPGYISPETFESKINGVTTKSDIFSAGVILHVLLTGQFLFAGQNLKDIMTKNVKMEFNLSNLKQMGIQTNAIDLLQKMLCIRPQDRLSAGQCLNHDFLREETSSNEDEKPDTPCTQGDIQVYQI